MSRFIANARFATVLALGAVLFVGGIVAGATGGTFILGVANSATSQTSLSAATSGNGTFVQNTSSGNGGVYVSNAATGIAGVTRNASRFALAGTNDGVTFNPAGGAVSASGKQNHGVNASTQNIAADAVRGVNGSTAGTPSDDTFANGVYGETRYILGNGVLGHANVDEGNAWGVWGDSASPDGVGVAGSNLAGGWAGLFIGDVFVEGGVFATSFTTPVTATLAINGGEALAAGDAVTLIGAEATPDGGFVALVRRATAGERVIGVADASVSFERSGRENGGMVARRGAHGAGAGDFVAIVTGGVYPVATVGSLAVGDAVSAASQGGVAEATDPAPAAGTTVGYVVGSVGDGRVLVYIDPH
jgi:hypothetical protein